jgi:sterol 24-C-methyltransferase
LCDADARTTKAGRLVTHYMVRAMELFRIAPKGSLEVATMLERAADGLVAGGKKGIFTPLFFFIVRKPLDSSSSRPSATPDV